MEISFNTYFSGDISKIRAQVEVEDYYLEQGIPYAEYELYDVEVQRVDGSIITVDSEDLEFILHVNDFKKINSKVLDGCRYQ